MQELIRQTEQSLDAILQFYHSKGARLSHRPVIKYVDSFFQPFPGVIGLIGGGFDFAARRLEVFLRNFGIILVTKFLAPHQTNGNAETNAEPENILEAYRRIHATRLAEELHGQNLERLVDGFRSILDSMQYAPESLPDFLSRSA